MQDELDFGREYETRDFHGYFQSRENHGNWKFCICSFDSTVSGEDGMCWVLCADKETQDMVPINAEDEITIDGKKYSREFWEH